MATNERYRLNGRLAAMAKRYAGGPDDVSEPLARGVELVPSFRSGLHLGNAGDPPPQMLAWLVDARAQHVLAMDNVGPDPLIPWASSAPDTVLVLRHHLPPGPVSEGDVVNWANGAVEQIDRWVRGNPVYRAMLESGRLICKVFNEPNLEGQFGPNGQVGTYDRYNDYFSTAAQYIKQRFPATRLAGFSLAPGNYDAYFEGDAAGRHYWLHGPEAAKANPTNADIAAAIQSCRCKDAIAAMDYFGIHVYPLVGTWDKPWLGTRFTRYWRFMPARLRANTVILEGTISDHGVPAGDYQRVRAEEEVLHLQKLAEYGPGHPQGTIKGRTGWWGKEGDPTWEIHEYLDGGNNPRPVAIAVKQFNAGATVPPPPPDTPPPPPPPGDSIQLPSWCTLHRAVVPAGQQYWHLVRAYWQDSDQSGGKHHIYALEPHDPTCSMYVRWGTTVDAVPLDKPASEPAGNYAMYGAEYQAWVEGRGAQLSDSVSGMKLPMRQHVAYYLEWELRTKGTTPPPPPPPTDEALKTLLLAEAERRIALRFNPGAALQKVIFAGDMDQFTPNSPEFFVTHNGAVYLGQRAENGRGKVRVYYCKSGDWSNVQFVERGAP